MSVLSRHAPLLAGAALALVVAVPVAADTTGGPENVDYANAGDASGMTSVQVSHDWLTGQYFLSASVSTSAPIACDSWEGEIDTTISVQGTPAKAVFGKQLSSATASGTINGVKDVYNSCTGEQTEEPVTMSVTIALVGSRYISTTTTKTVTKNPDGTTTTYSGKFSSTMATGTFSIDGTSMTAVDARISHDEMTVKTK